MKLQKNKEVKQNIQTGEKLLLYYMNQLEIRYGHKLSFGDYTDLMFTHPDLRIMRNYNSHNNDFCNYFKHNSIYRNCIKSTGCLKKISQKWKKPFYGRCYAGVEEYYFPVLLNGEVIGILCAGIFCSDRDECLKRVSEAAILNGRNPEKCREIYLKSLNKSDFNIKEFIADHQILCNLISSFYDSIIQSHGRQMSIRKFQDAYHYAFHNDILASAIHYIRENYTEDIHLEQVAIYCHCHPTYLSNLFMKKMHITFAKYIENARIEHAKELLVYTTLPIAEIGTRAGFKDPSYFGRVFKRHMNMTPNCYRKYKKGSGGKSN